MVIIINMTEVVKPEMCSPNISKIEIYDQGGLGSSTACSIATLQNYEVEYIVHSNGFKVERSSSNETNVQPIFCYECAGFHRESYMQERDCSVCKGRKCHNHGGLEMHSCKECNTKDLCVDCLSFGRCCDKK